MFFNAVFYLLCSISCVLYVVKVVSFLSHLCERLLGGKWKLFKEQSKYNKLTAESCLSFIVTHFMPECVCLLGGNTFFLCLLWWSNIWKWSRHLNPLDASTFSLCPQIVEEQEKEPLESQTEEQRGTRPGSLLQKGHIPEELREAWVMRLSVVTAALLLVGILSSVTAQLEGQYQTISTLSNQQENPLWLKPLSCHRWGCSDVMYWRGSALWWRMEPHRWKSLR